MLRLVFMRHLEAAEIGGVLRVMPGGNVPVRKTGESLKSKGVVPDLILRSGTERTKATARLLCEVFGFNAEQVKIDRNLGDKCKAEFTEQSLRGLPHDAITVFCITHKPPIDENTKRLIGTKAELDYAQACVIEFPEATSWADVNVEDPGANGFAMYVVTPAV